MTFSPTIDLGHILTLLGALALIAMYIVDTRYSTRGQRGELQRVSANIENLGHDLQALHTELMAHAEQDRATFNEIQHNFGETITALRHNMQGRADEIIEMIHNHELLVAREYIRQNTFDSAIKDLKSALDTAVIDMRSSALRLEDRFTKRT